jgi:hypothetical protein
MRDESRFAFLFMCVEAGERLSGLFVSSALARDLIGAGF